MGRRKNPSKPTAEMKARAREWRRFRFDNMLSQNTLSDVIGISRRTINNIEAGIEVNPHKRTLDAFSALQAVYEREGKPCGKPKRKHDTIQKQGEF